MTKTSEAVGFTPGPWHVSKRSQRKVTNSGGVVICNAVLRNMGGPKHHTCLKSEHEAEANACLIAAAPELLEALDNIPLPSTMGTAEEHYRRFYNWHRDVVEPLLRKARGR